MIRLGPYQVQGRIGAGGMAEVFAAVHTRTRQPRAIKVVTLPGAAIRARFLREARLQRRVDHPNVLPVLDLLDLDGHPALVLPLIRGPSLQRLLREAPPPLPDRLALFREVVAGVAAIHAAGLVHRDLKPANVLLDPDGPGLGVRVADFGVAKALTPDTELLTRAGAAVGTRAYMAPEQEADASTVDARADVWALGCILRALVSGEERAPDPQRDAALSWPDPAWSALYAAATASDREARPRDAADLLVRLPATEPVSDELRATCVDLAPVPEAPAAVGATTVAPATEAPRNLIAERDPFIGRASELVALADRVAEARLVTLIGPPGVGKTRLVSRFAALSVDDFPGGTWFCDLSDARDADAMLTAVAGALELRLRAEPAAEVAGALAARGRCLVVLDNFEQLVGQAEDRVGAWVDRAPQARFVVTSRARLGLPGEQVFDVAPLSREDAVALFQRRAAAVGRDVSTADAGVVSELMSLLDGLPLAIELAAARSAMLDPASLLRRMHERFRLLSGGAGRPDRQATLRRTLDWSWDLLDEAEQAALVQLSVFEGGFTVEAAEEVLDVGGWALDAIQGLLDKSLVRAVEDGRFGLLVSVQAYAREKLAPADVVAAEIRHGRRFAGLGTSESLRRLREPGGARVWWSWWAERDNLLAAIDRAVARGDAAVAAPCAHVVRHLLERRGPVALQAAMLERVLAVPGLDPVDAAVLSLSAAEARQPLGDADLAAAHHRNGLASYDVAVAEAQARGDRWLEGRLRADRAVLRSREGHRDEAAAEYEAALAIAREVGNRWSEANVLGNLGVLRSDQGRTDEARALFEAALEGYREVGNRMEEVFARGNLGVLHAWQGRLDEARAQFEAALAIQLEEGNRAGEANTRSNLGALHAFQGRLDEARAQIRAATALYGEAGNGLAVGRLRATLGDLELVDQQLEVARSLYAEALDTARRLRDRGGEAAAACGLGAVALRAGRWDEARARLEAALAQAEGADARVAGGAVAWLAEGHLQAGDLGAARARLEAAFAALEALGDRLGRGRLLCLRAALERACGDPAAGQRAEDEARALAVALGAGPDSDLGRRLALLGA